MGIGKITFGNFGSNIFKTNNGQNIQSENVQETGKVTTNPFGVSFKGNVIHADVFESSKINETKDAAQNNIKTRGKLFISAFVGNINNFNDAIKSRVSKCNAPIVCINDSIYSTKETYEHNRQFFETKFKDKSEFEE